MAKRSTCTRTTLTSTVYRARPSSTRWRRLSSACRLTTLTYCRSTYVSFCDIGRKASKLTSVFSAIRLQDAPRRDDEGPARSRAMAQGALSWRQLHVDLYVSLVLSLVLPYPFKENRKNLLWHDLTTNNGQTNLPNSNTRPRRTAGPSSSACRITTPFCTARRNVR